LGAVVGAALLVLLAGCGADSEGSGSGTEETSSPSSSPPTVRVPTSTPVVEPADGPLIKTEGATIRGLKGMRLISDYGALQGYRNDQAHVSFIRGYSDKRSLDAMARQHKRILLERLPKGSITRVDDVVVGGEYNAYHFLDTSDPVEENHIFGLMFLNGSWEINIGYYDDGIDDVEPLTAEERVEATASILASFEPTFN
jgi:hypothetical protein